MITITHTHAEGTLVTGSSKGDGVYEILHALHGHWRYFRSLGCLGLLQSRDKPAKTWIIAAAASALREAGHEVTVSVDDGQRRDVAEVEADRAARAEARVERFGGYAENASSRAASTYAQARQMAEAIPVGQPMMPDHHSYGRDRRYRERMGRTYERAFAEMSKAEHYEQRAEAAEATQRHREAVPVTLRRIERLEADARRIERAMGAQEDWSRDRDAASASVLVRFQSCGARRARQQAALDDLNAQIAYWRQHIEQSGQKVWGPADFAKGDFVHGRWGWAQVLRVNPKSLTIPWGVNAVHLAVVTVDNVKTAIGGPGWTDKVTYDDVRGRKSADEMAALLAEVAERKAAEALVSA